ncbi:tRNA/rRNA cytosine-C5-methylase [Spirochaeta africana]|uniref:NOL1/NOP2/Sun domain family member 4 n=1 Tax=Spirochaeta africana (strain ATCC 700263 / DSM 8902 / Z-7692) TaxID=889378 RepID=H9UHC9_SPIAZ|nr:tRNA/rRNA cytosine-C5-methylase [Spirochaeta africana]AFG36922.1 tRNA/rRNA cytosine-C5-methylase [Spirochaeta africana DSM 8902]
MKQKRRRPSTDRPGFDEFYSRQWGDRWPVLRAAFTAPTNHFALKEGLRDVYYLDPASVWAASLLPLPGFAAPAGSAMTDDALQVLDLCAAPGGKTLVLLQRLAAAGVHFEHTANDRSSQRRRRLHQVLEQYLPAELRAAIRVTGHDATRWGLHQRDRYGLVIADVPCSSEAHVVQSPEHLAKWSPSRAKRLAQQAYTILLAALDATAPGGFILYSTCSVNQGENDDVIARALKRRPGAFSVHPVAAAPRSDTTWIPGAEATVYGWQVLPDACSGAGPLYAAVLRKTA